MRRAPSRSHWRLRLLRTRAVRRMREDFRDATTGVLRQLRRRARAKRPGFGIDFAEEPAKRAGQRVLFVSVRRTFRGGRGWRAFLSPGAVSGLVHRRVRPRLYCVGHLVWPDCAEK